MGSVPSVDRSVGKVILTRRLAAVKRQEESSLGITFPLESHGRPDMSAMLPPNDAGDDMVCDGPSNPLLTVNGITKTQGNGEDNINVAPGAKGDYSHLKTSSDNEFFTKYGLVRTDFSNYTSFHLNSSVGREDNNSDTVKLNCISTTVQFLEQQLAKITEATSLELIESKVAHDAEMRQMLIECDKKLNEGQIVSEGKIRELNCCLEAATNAHSATQHQLRYVQDTFQLELQDCKKNAQKMQAELDEKMTQITRTKKSLDVKNRDMIAKKVDLEVKLRHSQEAAKASDQEVEQLKSSIEVKNKALGDLMSETSQLKSKCQKVEAQLAQIEQKAAQESLTSGSYADDHANPSMLEDACKSVDKATDNLIRVLHSRSITSKSCSSKSQDQHLERFLNAISPASLANFSRPVQVKYAWGHWICFTIFHDFEHVFFNGEDRSMTSPLDSKIHALECFQSFQQKKHMPSMKLYEGCGMFQAFCVKKYKIVFPLDLIETALHPQSGNKIVCDSYGRFNDDSDIYQQFLDVAKAIWLLHQLSFSFDPPANILRMATGLPFDKQYHEPAIHDADNDGMARAVLLMIRPAFRLRNSIIRSRVFLMTSARVDTSKTPGEQEVEQRVSSLVTALAKSV